MGFGTIEVPTQHVDAQRYELPSQMARFWRTVG